MLKTRTASGIATLAITLLTAACSTSADPVTTTTTPPTTAPPTTTVADPASTVVVTTTTTTVAPTTTTTAAMSERATGFLIAGEAGIRLVADDEVRTILDTPASVAFDDLMGGVVFQRIEADGGFGAPDDTIVWWLPAGAVDPQSLLVPSGDDRLRLVGVESIDGAPTVAYIRRENSNDFETAEDTLSLYVFDSSEVRDIRTIGGWEGGAGHITYGGGIFASNWYGEAYSGFAFFDAAGSDVTMSGNPYEAGAICFDGTIEPGGGRCFANVAISPDGERLAYTVPFENGDGIVSRLDLVVVDAADGTERARITIRDREPFSVGSIDLRRDLALVGPGVFATELPTMVVDVGSETITPLEVPGVAAFATTSTGG